MVVVAVVLVVVVVDVVVVVGVVVVVFVVGVVVVFVVGDCGVLYTLVRTTYQVYGNTWRKGELRTSPSYPPRPSTVLWRELSLDEGATALSGAQLPKR